jgi:hypothetical protein
MVTLINASFEGPRDIIGQDQGKSLDLLKWDCFATKSSAIAETTGNSSGSAMFLLVGPRTTAHIDSLILKVRSGYCCNEETEYHEPRIPLTEPNISEVASLEPGPEQQDVQENHSAP